MSLKVFPDLSLYVGILSVEPTFDTYIGIAV